MQYLLKNIHIKDFECDMPLNFDYFVENVAFANEIKSVDMFEKTFLRSYIYLFEEIKYEYELTEEATTDKTEYFFSADIGECVRNQNYEYSKKFKIKYILPNQFVLDVDEKYYYLEEISKDENFQVAMYMSILKQLPMDFIIASA